jgi:hypothetical protein
MNYKPTSSLSPAVSPRSRMWLGASLLLVVLRAFPSICYPIARDQATYCYIGQRLWEGKQLYLDLWDNKPPGIFFLYAVMVKILGNVMWQVGLLDILWLLIISVFIFKFAERHLGTAPAVIAVIVHATWRAWSGYWDAAQPENFLVLFVIAAYFLSSYEGKPRWLYDFQSGILFGVAFWFKYNAVTFVPLLLVLPHLDFSPLAIGARFPRFTLSGREWMKRVGIWITASALCMAVVLGYLAWFGAWPAMREIQFEVLPRYNAMAYAWPKSYFLFVLQQIRVYLGWWSVLVAAVALLVARRARDLSATLPVFLATAMGLMCTAMQGRLPSFAFETCFPFFAMLWGYLAVKVFQGFRHISRQCWSRGFRLAAVLVWIVLANLVYLPLPDEVVQFKLDVYNLKSWYTDRDSYYRNYPWARPISHFDGQMHVIKYLRENSTPKDGVLVWGSEPLIYFLAQRNPPTRFVSNLGLISLWTPPAWRRELIRNLEGAPPKYIVVAREDWVPMISFNFLDSQGYLRERFPALLGFVTSGYQKVDDYKEFSIFRHD